MYLIAKRIFDFCASLVGLIILSPILLIIALIVILGSKGGAFYYQERVGKDLKPFRLIKFRSMRINSDVQGQITIGKDPRITRIGTFIRRYKLDELPQLINILIGQMSIVGPRPEVPKYVKMYSEEQLKVLSVKPGLTDYASIQYVDEQTVLGAAVNPDETYVKEIMPAKLALNLKYIQDRSFILDLKLIGQTIGRIFF